MREGMARKDLISPSWDTVGDEQGNEEVSRLNKVTFLIKQVVFSILGWKTR